MINCNKIYCNEINYFFSVNIKKIFKECLCKLNMSNLLRHSTCTHGLMHPKFAGCTALICVHCTMYSVQFLLYCTHPAHPEERQCVVELS